MKDFYKGDAWRVFRIMAEFVEGFEELSRIKPAITIFGSSRTTTNSIYYKNTIELAKKLAKKGFSIITGAGAGIMEAANKGAKEAKGRSIGLNIQLPLQQKANSYITDLIEFRHFFVRKVMFLRYATATVFVPGGYGTMDELFETLTLIQTERIEPIPIYVLGKDYWNGLFKWINDFMVGDGCIDHRDIELLTITDDINLIVNDIYNHYKSN